MSARIYYVYEHWRPDTDACFYVGKGKDQRAYIFNHSWNRRYDLIVRKLARAGLCVEVRLVQGGLSENEAFDLERERIAFWRSVGISITNKTDGGEGTAGRRHSKETRAKIGAANKGRLLSQEAREKLRQINLGKKHSPETRAKMSASRKGNTNGAGGRGLKRSKETLARMSAAQIGHTVSEETRAKLRLAAKAQHARERVS